MKKMFSILCAVNLLIGSILSMSASADNSIVGENYRRLATPALSEGEYGEARLTIEMESLNFIVITDSSGLEEMSLDYMTKEDIRAITEISKSKFNERILNCLDENSTSIISSYGSDVRYYEVCTSRRCQIWKVDSTDEPHTILAQLARNFMLTHDSVRDIFIYKNMGSGTGEWNGTLTPHILNASDKFEDVGSFIDEFNQKWDESSLIKEAQHQYASWKEQIDEWKRKVNTSELTKEEVYLSRKENGVPTDYEMMRYAYDISEKILEQFEEIDYVEAEYEYTADGKNFYYSITSAWADIGDVNSDKEINSTDAALLLQYSSAIGAGVDSSDSDTSDMDVNADGIVNAQDASIILQYSAARGSGFSGNLGAFIQDSKSLTHNG